jgi:hypothetical protein
MKATMTLIDALILATAAAVFFVPIYLKFWKNPSSSKNKTNETSN